MKVEIYTDGSARGNPGPGGYGIVILYKAADGTLHRREYSEGFRLTTNNRMELLAAAVGLEKLIRPCRVDIYSDSRYLTEAFNKNWIQGWIRDDFRIGRKNPVKNIDLWKRLLKAKEPHDVTFCWLRGHDGHPENEYCDRLAVRAAQGENLKEDEGFGGKA